MKTNKPLDFLKISKTFFSFKAFLKSFFKTIAPKNSVFYIQSHSFLTGI